MNKTDSLFLKKLWFLSGTLSDGRNWIIPIDKDPFFIGRSQECHLVLAPKEISRKHARISRKEDVLVLEDLNSTNGTFVNDKSIKSIPIRHKDWIKFGNLKFHLFLKDFTSSQDLSGTLDLIQPQKDENFSDLYELTPREREVMSQLVDGETIEVIAHNLSVKPRTIKNHYYSLMKKTYTKGRIDLVALFHHFNALTQG